MEIRPMMLRITLHVMINFIPTKTNKLIKYCVSLQHASQQVMSMLSTPNFMNT